MQFKDNLIPSLLAFKEMNFNESVNLLKKNKFKTIHLDVMDKELVGNVAFNEKDLKNLSLNDFKIKVHLMTIDPFKESQKFLDKNTLSITFQFEHLDSNYVKQTLDIIKSKNIKAGIAISPYTEYSKYSEFLEFCDCVTIMGVEPGRGGQSFIKESLKNLNKVYEYKINNKNIDIEFDGGINNQTISLVENKSDFVVSGSFLLACMLK